MEPILFRSLSKMYWRNGVASAFTAEGDMTTSLSILFPSLYNVSSKSFRKSKLDNLYTSL
ncbi:hypothetical protein [uncultured Methanobrevibacter sp.]|uniref:hypothetical protein n=1 Tax=uncultured Methanobrevibacter sp. TaxID=253161 RepID=UPI0025D35437|nr:hypothetical protein [uncultured Methanobrevibacter sp.]